MTTWQERPPIASFRRPDVVPYITAWSSEQSSHSLVVARSQGIGYSNEDPYDRDADGILWGRISSSPGKGRPEFGRVHYLRQRRAMRKLLCQVCARPADHTAEGILWLLGENPADRSSWPNDLITTHPPLCMKCAVTSVRLCPHLRKQYVALRVRDFEPVGVRGALYSPGFPFPRAFDTAGVAYGDPQIHWVRAAQLIVRLQSYSVVELAA